MLSWIGDEAGLPLVVTEDERHVFDAVIGADGASGLTRAYVAQDISQKADRCAYARLPLPSNYQLIFPPAARNYGLAMVSISSAIPLMKGVPINLVLCCEASTKDSQMIATQTLSQNRV